MSNFIETTLDKIKAAGRSVVSGPFGSNISAKFFVSSGVPVIRGNNLSLGTSGPRFVDDDFVFLTVEKADELSSSEALPNDLIFTARGTIGQVGIIPKKSKYSRYILSANQLRFRPDPKVADPMFLYYWFSQPNLVFYMQGLNQGSALPNMNLGTMRTLPVRLPPLPEQRAIAEVLSSLDDKIELNRRMNYTLEQLAQTLFKHWFIDNPESENWEKRSLTNLYEINPYRELKKGSLAQYLDMANIPVVGHRVENWYKRTFSSGSRYSNGDTLLARITPCLENGKTAFVDFLNEGEVGWGSTEFIVLHPKFPLPHEFGYYLARSDDFRNFSIQNMSGTSGRQRVPISCFDSYQILEPPIGLAKEFGEIASELMKLIRTNDNQSRTLSELRDTLLPKLMSGKIKVL